MEQAFIDILKQMVKEQGKDVFNDIRRFRALLADYTRNEYKKESRLILQSVEAGVPKIIEGAENLAACKKGKIKDLEEEYGLSAAFASNIVDALAFVLRGDTTKTVIETLTVGTTPVETPTAPTNTASSTPVKEKKTFASGNVYEGETVNGIPHGKGKKTLANGDVYEGDFVNGELHGKGKFTYLKGQSYEGDFVNGEPHGKGKMKNVNGSTYEGDFVNGKYHGKGKYTWPGGDVYEGYWVKHQRHGKGKMIMTNGDVYEGDFFNDMKHGKGKMTYANGKVKNGDWEYEEFKGKGILGKLFRK